MSVYLTDGNQRAALAAVRGLGRNGVATVVGAPTPRSLAGASRSCLARDRYPDPLVSPNEFTTHMRSVSSQHELTIPITDVALYLFAHDSVLMNANPALPPAAAISVVQDKLATIELAQRFGVATPRTWAPATLSEVEALASRVSYPAVLKPRWSRFLDGGQWQTGTVEYASTPAELIARYRAMHCKIPLPLIQEKVHGKGCGVFLMMWDGEVKAVFAHRRLREKPATGGVSVLSESVVADPTLVARSAAMLRSINWRGVVMLEFKCDERDGAPKLMEINGRLWGSLHLAVRCGVNFPLLWYRASRGETLPNPPEFRTGVRCRWFAGDVRRLGGILAGKPCDEGRWRATVDFFRPNRKTFLEDIDVGDPMPTLVSITTNIFRAANVPAAGERTAYLSRANS